MLAAAFSPNLKCMDFVTDISPNGIESSLTIPSPGTLQLVCLLGKYIFILLHYKNVESLGNADWIKDEILHFNFAHDLTHSNWTF